jgi:hypothetical protein
VLNNNVGRKNISDAGISICPSARWEIFYSKWPVKELLYGSNK